MGTSPDDNAQLEQELKRLYPELRTYADWCKQQLPPSSEPLELVNDAIDSIGEWKGDVPLKVFLKRKIRENPRALNKKARWRDELLAQGTELILERVEDADAPHDDRLLAVRPPPGCSARTFADAAEPEARILEKEKQDLSDDVMLALLERAETNRKGLTVEVLNLYLDGCERGEIADALGIAPSKVDAELQRVRRLLDGVLQDNQDLQKRYEELIHAPD